MKLIIYQKKKQKEDGSMTDKLKKAIFFVLIDTIKKHNDFNIVWNAIPKKNAENRQIILDIAEKVSSYPLDEIEHRLIQECAIFKRKIFWDYPEDFINLLKTNIKISINNLRKNNVRN